MNKITPFLWFDDNAEQAADFYLSIFPNSRRLSELRTTEAGPGPVGSLLVMDLELNGQQVTFMNGGPGHPPTVAFSFVIRCEDQQEIDHYWSLLTEGGKEVACGWLADKFGLSWQVVPTNLTRLVNNPAGMRAMMKMVKFEIATLEKAAAELQ
jgi:predicted 3-demethylubiquinone-9 3-methyltransferase (glyoxalase superfamily)